MTRKILSLFVAASVGITPVALAAQNPPIVAFTAQNGFVLTADHRQQLLVEAPWGEEASLRLEAYPDGAAVGFDSVRVRFHVDGAIALWQDGVRVPPQTETQVLAAAGARFASPAFWEGLRDSAAELGEQLPVLEAGCGLKGMSCFFSLVGAVGSVAALIAVCGGTFGTACAGGLLLHLSANGLAATQCAAWLACLEAAKPKKKIDDDDVGPREAPAQG